MSDQAKVPVAVEELNEMGVDTSEIPDDMVYASIYSSPYDAKRGIKRWIDDGCPDPFKFSSSYTKLFNECVNLRDAHKEVSDNLIDVCQERDGLKTKVKNLENEIGDKGLALTDAESENTMSSYRIESLTKQNEELESDVASLKNRLQKVGEDLAVERNETARLNAQIKELSQTMDLQDKDIKKLEERNDQASKSNQRLLDRLEGSGWRRFVCGLFGI